MNDKAGNPIVVIVMPGDANRKRLLEELQGRFREARFHAVDSGAALPALLAQLMPRSATPVSDENLGHATLDSSRIVNCDASFAELFGAASAKALENTALLQYIDGEDHHKVRSAIKASAGGARPVAPEVLGVVRASGDRAALAMFFDVAYLDDKVLIKVKVRNASAAEIEQSGYNRRRSDQAMNTALVARIKAALRDNTLALAAQAISDLAGTDDGESVRRLDVLVRLKDAQGELPARDFLEGAKAAGLIRLIDRWVIRHACRLIRENAAKGRMLLFLRISRQALQDKVTLVDVQAECKALQVAPDQLSFELPESDIAELTDAEWQVLEGLRKLGCALTISAFGVRADAVQLMHKLAPKYVKLNAKLTNQAHNSEAATKALEDLVVEAKAQNVLTVSTQVSDASTLAFLWKLGIHFVQGYYVREPEIVLQGERNR
jgi:EAL domain-containing protein (putative c-di-GMP-specific phosphodiesterase class I)